jgi:hypothetical protein
MYRTNEMKPPALSMSARTAATTRALCSRAAASGSGGEVIWAAAKGSNARAADREAA